MFKQSSSFCTVLLSVVLTFPINVSADTASIEEQITNQILDFYALLQNGANEPSDFKETRKQLILLNSRYTRKGGDDFRFIQAANNFILNTATEVHTYMLEKNHLGLLEVLRY